MRTLAILAAALVAGCQAAQRLDVSVPEEHLVLRPGQTLTATTPEGRVSVTAAEGTLRSFEWSGNRVVDELRLDHDDTKDPKSVFTAGHGTSWTKRVVARERNLHLASWVDVEDWMAESGRGPWVWTDDGLMVAFREVRLSDLVFVDVVQVWINGERPVNAPGATPDAVRLVDDSTGDLPERRASP